MFRRIATSIVMLALLEQPGFANPAQVSLSPGKPAGVHDAQMIGNGLIFVVAAAGVLVLGLYLSSGTYKGPSMAAATTPMNTQ